MNTNYNDCKNKALEVLKVLDLMGIDACVAGGFVRDMSLGIKPKDMDICLLHDLTESQESMLKVILTNPVLSVDNGQPTHAKSKDYSSFVKVEDTEDTYHEACVTTLYEGMLGDMPVDIIRFAGTYTNPAGLVNTFDMSCNQGYIYKGLVELPRLDSLVISNLKRATPERVIRMLKLLQDYNEEAYGNPRS